MNYSNHLLLTPLLLVFSLIFQSYSNGEEPNSSTISFLDKPFDPFLGSKKVKGNEEQFYAPKLDSLLKTSNGIYFLPDIQGEVFEDYSVTVISRSKEKQVLLLFYDRNSIIRDTLMHHFNQTFSLNTELKLGKKGVCIGYYFEKENYFKISAIYEISKKIKLKKVTYKNQIIKCQLPPKYLTEENPYLSETFTFGLGEPEIKYIDGLFKVDLVVEENFVRIIPPKNSNFYLPDSSVRIYPHCFGDFNADKKQDVLVYLGACGTGGCMYGLFLNQFDNYYKLAFNDYLKNPEFKTEKNGFWTIESSEEITPYNPSKRQVSIFKFDKNRNEYKLKKSFIFKSKE